MKYGIYFDVLLKNPGLKRFSKTPKHYEITADEILMTKESLIKNAFLKDNILKGRAYEHEIYYYSLCITEDDLDLLKILDFDSDESAKCYFELNWKDRI